MPKVSVIIPVYNVEKYLRECLDSVINQTLKDIEVICVDDGSTDSSLEILKEYAQKDNRVIVLSQKNKGASAARNKGLKLAQGECLYFFDSDDFLDVTALEKLYNRISATNADICICKNNTYNDNTLVYTPCGWEKSLDLVKGFETFNYLDVPDVLFQFCNIPTYTKLYRKNFINSNGIYFQTIKTCNDVFFNLYTLAMASSITILNETLITYRLGHICLTKNRSKYISCILKAAVKTKKALKNAKRYHILEKTFCKRFSDSFNYELGCCKDLEYKNHWMLKLYRFLPAQYWSKAALALSAEVKKRNKQKIQNIFSVKNNDGHKVITILGLKIKIRRKSRARG